MKRTDGCIILKYIVIACKALANYFSQEIKIRAIKNQILTNSQ